MEGTSTRSPIYEWNCGLTADGNDEAPHTSAGHISGARGQCLCWLSVGKPSQHRLYGVGQTPPGKLMARVLDDYRNVGNRSLGGAMID